LIRGLSEIFLARQRSRERWRPLTVDPGRDRRVFYRVSLQMPCKLIQPMFGLEAAGSTIDLSLEGAGLFAPVNWAEGSRVRLQLESVDFESAAVIVYRKQEEVSRFRYGVKFEHMGFFQIVKLRRWLQKKYSGRLSE
jgi:hypothetical protein